MSRKKIRPKKCLSWKKMSRKIFRTKKFFGRKNFSTEKSKIELENFPSEKIENLKFQKITISKILIFWNLRFSKFFSFFFENRIFGYFLEQFFRAHKFESMLYFGIKDTHESWIKCRAPSNGFRMGENHQNPSSAESSGSLYEQDRQAQRWFSMKRTISGSKIAIL